MRSETGISEMDPCCRPSGAATLSCTLTKSPVSRTKLVALDILIANRFCGRSNRPRSTGARRLTAETCPSVSIEVARVAAEDRRHHNGSRRQAARTAEISRWPGCQRDDGPSVGKTIRNLLRWLEPLATGRGRRDRSPHGLTLPKKGGRRLCANAKSATGQDQ